MHVKARMGLQNDEDNIWGPPHKSQHHAATQGKPVVGVVVNQAFKGIGYQSLAEWDLEKKKNIGEG